jgi:hypothetical protein
MKHPVQIWRAKETTMSDDRRKILDMLAQGRLTADEAERLLGALDSRAATIGPVPIAELPRPGGATPRYLRVQVSKPRNGGEDKNVNIRVPLQLLKAGVKLQGLLPPKARDELNAAMQHKGVGFDFNQLRPDNLDDFIAALSQSSIDIDVDDGRSRVRISCE